MATSETLPIRSRSRASARRRGAACILAGVLAVSLGGPACLRAEGLPAKPNILLVHGAFADGSSWNGVTRRLESDGYHVVVSQIPLTSFADDVAAVQRDLRVFGGPTLLVGHSYGGAVITQAAEGAANVVGLVYVAAVAPDTGEKASDFNTLAPALPSQGDFTPIDLPHVGQNDAPFVIIKREKFGADFCQDCRPATARLLAANEAPVNASAFSTPLTGVPAWRQLPAWYQISTEDRIINPAAQRIMAQRMDPNGVHTIRLKTGHASLITRPAQVARFLERAAR